MCDYIISFELILSKILERRQSRIFLKIATLRYQFCDMTSFKYGGWGLWERWRSELMVWELGETWTVWDTGELQAFNQPANQQASQSNSQPTDWPFCQSAKTSDKHTPSLIARASPPPSVGGYKGISIVARPARPPQVHPSLSRSGFFSSFAFCYGGLVRLRFASAVFWFILFWLGGSRHFFSTTEFVKRN